MSRPFRRPRRYRLGDAVIVDLEETDIDRGLPECISDFVLAVVEVRKVDDGDFPVNGRADAADGRFLGEFREGVCLDIHIILLT